MLEFVLVLVLWFVVSLAAALFFGHFLGLGSRTADRAADRREVDRFKREWREREGPSCEGESSAEERLSQRENRSCNAPHQPSPSPERRGVDGRTDPHQAGSGLVREVLTRLR